MRIGGRRRPVGRGGAGGGSREDREGICWRAGEGGGDGEGGRRTGKGGGREEGGPYARQSPHHLGIA